MMRLIRECFCVLFLFLNTSGWEIGRLYNYSFSNGLRGTNHYNKKFDDATDLAFGVFQFKWDSPQFLTGKLIQKFKEDYTQKHPFVIPKESFQAVFENDLVSDLKVSPNLTAWDIEFIRAVLSVFQISDQIKEKDNFSIVEESVVGKCEAHYEVKSKNDSSGALEISTIIKTKNLTNCDKIPVHKSGVFGKNYDVLLKKRDSIDRTSVTHYVLNKNGVEEMRVRETIKIKLETRSVTFINSLALTNGTSILLEDNLLDKGFETDDLVSVGGLMYKNSNCRKNTENEIDATCETDHYMNPKTFRTSYPGSEVKVAKELVQQIVKELEDTAMIEAADTLDRFAILVRAIRQLDLGQMEETSESWKSDSREALVFQNAVIFSGTLDALKMIKNLEKKDQLVVKNPMRVLPQLLQLLNLDYLDTFFEFATDSEVMRKDPDFARDLILEFTNLLRRYQTEEDKPFEEEQFRKKMSEKYRRHISDKLQESHDRGDKLNFQVYARAAGNMADLAIFSHYLFLESLNLTIFQRTHLINTMDRSVEIHPEKSRVMLLRVYENSKEASSVRTAAAFQLFKTNLTQEQVLKIIQVAKDSDDSHIQNAVKTTVLSKAYDYRTNKEINKMAQTINLCGNKRTKREEAKDKVWSGQKGTLLIENVAIPLIEKFFSEHVFRNGSSYNTFRSTLIEVFRRTGTDPTSIFVTKTKDERGFKTSTRVGGMLDYFRILQQRNGQVPKDTSANLEIDFDFGQIFVPFENLRTSPINYLIQYLQGLRNVKKLMLFMDEMFVGFPTETGFPFLFSCQTPKVLSYQEKVYLDDFKADVNLFYSDRKEIRMGIVNPLNGKHYLYGVDVNRIVSIPFVVSYKYYKNHLHPHHIILEPLFRDKDQRILHLSTWEYLETRDFFPVEPITGNKYNNSLVSERVFVSRSHWDESARLRATVISPRQSGMTIHEFIKSEELKTYFTNKLFGTFIPNSFDVYFKEDENYKNSSLILKNKDPTYANFTRPSMQNSPGIYYEYDFGAEITGRTNRWVRLTYRAEENDRKEIVYSSLYSNYNENKTQLYESAFDTSINHGEGSSDLRCGSENYTIGVNSLFRFVKPKTPTNVTFVSAEFAFHPRDYFANSNLDLNVTIDHDLLPKRYHDKICSFDGGDYEFLGVDYHLGVNRKNPESCRK